MLYSKNSRAYFDFDILETYQAGISLKGYEVKAVKKGKMSIKGAYVKIKDGEVFLIGAVISPYQAKNTPENYDPQRTRRLLLKKKEINSLIGRAKEKGLTLIPLEVYNIKNRIKVKIGLAKAKKKIDKRELIKKREEERKIERVLKLPS